MNHTDLVAQVKAELEARGLNLIGPCGAFEITKRVAWALRHEGAGLLAKPGGNNCQGYATDIVLYNDGRLVDMLGDGGNTNGPRWDETGEIRPRDQWRPPFDPGDEPATVEPPAAPATSSLAATLDEIKTVLAALDRRVEALAKQSDANTEKIQQQIAQAVADVEKSIAAALPLFSSILGKR